MNEQEPVSKEKRKEQAFPYALYLKQQGKLDISIIDEISVVFDLSTEESKEILEATKTEFPQEIKKSAKSNILRILPVFIISLVVFVGWYILSMSETWLFFIGGMYGIISGLLSLLSGFYLDRMLNENYPNLRLRLRIFFSLVLVYLILGLPLYSLISKSYRINEKDLIILTGVVLTDSPNLKHEKNLISSIEFNFLGTLETCVLSGSEFNATQFSELYKLKLKAGDTLDIFLKRDTKTNGYYKSLFSKKINIYNLKKNGIEYVDLYRRNEIEKRKIQNSLIIRILLSLIVFNFIFIQVKRLRNLHNKV